MEEPAEREHNGWNPEEENGVVVGDMTFPPKPPNKVPWKQHMANVMSLQLRSSDIFICAYPKAGTHWLSEITHMLLNAKAEYDVRTKEHMTIEFNTKDGIDELVSPRILNTHLYFSMLPVQQLKQEGVKVLHVYRNPKDVVVSMYFHFQQIAPAIRRLSLLQFLHIFLGKHMIYGNYFTFMKQMDAFVRENPDVPVFQLSFESLKKNSVEQVRRLGEFLGTNPSEELCQEISEACGFERLKQADATKHLPNIPGLSMTKETRIYRKGEAGDWKNHLTVSMSEMIDEAIDYHLTGSSCNLLFT